MGQITQKNNIKKIISISITIELYSQTWVNVQLRIGTTCQQRPQFESPLLDFYYKVTSEQGPPVNNGHYFEVPRVVVVRRIDCTLNSVNCSVPNSHSWFAEIN